MTTCYSEKINDVTKCILDCMTNGNYLFFYRGDVLYTAIRGTDISGFTFETSAYSKDSELLALQKEKMKVEIQNLRNLNSGEDWKNLKEDED